MGTTWRSRIMAAGCLVLSQLVVDGCAPARGRHAPTKAPLVARERKVSSDKRLTLDLGDGVTMDLLLIPAGTYTMGPPDRVNRQLRQGSRLHLYEGPQRRTTLTRPFHLGVTEVTQAQWRAVMKTEPWQGKPFAENGANHAASWISWDSAAAFCRALSEETGWSVRLPTEAEWEYACRARATTLFCYGDDPDYGQLAHYAWYRDNTCDVDGRHARPVAAKKPNAWGLYDMHGNVFEWCSDWHGSIPEDPAHPGGLARAVSDPTGPTRGTRRVVRGGAWNVGAPYCRSAFRLGSRPWAGLSCNGFRVVVDSAPMGD